MGDMMGQYTKRSFSAPIRGGATVEHAVYERGDGPPVVLIQELPGIGKETLRLADRFMAKGFRVVMPHLFGPLGRTSLVGNTVRVLCMRREFAIFNSGDSSPVIDWLRALCNDVRDAAGVRGVGVIGMCLTGNFAISLMADASVLAAVASQPSLPVFKKNELHMGEASIAAARGRLDQEGPMLAYRFKGDPMCSGAKFKAIAKHFNDDAAERVKLVTLPGRGHSVLTLDFVDEAGHPTTQALDEVLAYFTRKLMPA